MNSLKIIQEGSTHHSSGLCSLKETLLKEEYARLKTCLARTTLISNTIKLLNSTLGRQKTSSEDLQSMFKELLRPLWKQVADQQRLLCSQNLFLKQEVQAQDTSKKHRQQVFLEMLRGYQAKMAELDARIKLIEKSLQYYSHSAHSSHSQSEERFDEGLSSTFLEPYLLLQRQKQQAILALQKAASKMAPGSQTSCQSREIIEDPENLCESILLKEKIVQQGLKGKISKMRTQQGVEKSNFDRLTAAVRQSNARISDLNLEISISGCNSFLLEGEHYARHWRNMKQTIDARLSEGIPTHRLRRSKSCTVMEASKMDEDAVSVSFEKSLSLQQESLLENLEYFVSQKFIRDLVSRSDE